MTACTVALKYIKMCLEYQEFSDGTETKVTKIIYFSLQLTRQIDTIRFQMY